MKELSRNKIVWMDENAPEVTDSAQGCDLWCYVMPFQVQSYLRYFQERDKKNKINSNHNTTISERSENKQV